MGSQHSISYNEVVKEDVSRISADDLLSDHSNETEAAEPPLQLIGESGAGNAEDDPVIVQPVEDGVPDDIDAALQECAKAKDYIVEALEKFNNLLNKIDQEEDNLREKLERTLKLEREEKKKKYYKPINLFATPYLRDVRGGTPSRNEDSIRKMANGDVDAYVAPPRPWTAPEHKYLRDAAIENARRQELTPLFASRDYYKDKLAHGIVSDEQVADIEEKLETIDREIENIRMKSDHQLLQLDGKLDWMRISASLPDICRSPDDCERMWRNYVHPTINKKTWTKEEDNELRKVAAKHQYHDWEQIASELILNRRTAIQCLQRYQCFLNNNMLKSTWTPEDDEELRSVVESCRNGNHIPWNQEDDEELRSVVESCRNGNHIPWNQVTYKIPGRTRLQIVNRWTRSIAPDLKKAPWSPEEDAILLAAVDKYGYKWSNIKDLLPGRSNVACRERYTNVLAPGVIVGNWTKEEDRLLVKLARQHPEGKWSKIAEHFNDRTDNMCLQRVRRIRKHHPHLFDPDVPFSDIEDDFGTEELFTRTHNCQALNANRENIRLAAEKSLTKTIMKVRGYKTIEEAMEAVKSMKASRTFLFQLSRELLSEEGENAYRRNAENAVEKSNHAKMKRVVRKPAVRTKGPQRIARARQARIAGARKSRTARARSELSEDVDSETESDAMSFHDDEDEDFSERREESEEEFYPERRTTAVNHERTEEEEAVDAELDSLFFPLVVSGIRHVKKSKFVYQSARNVLEHKLLKSSLYKALHCVEDEASDNEEESREETVVRGIDYADSVPRVLRNFVFDSPVQEEIPVFPPNQLTLQNFKFLLINYKQMLYFLYQNPSQDSHIVSIISSQEIYTLLCASCYKTRSSELELGVVVNVPDFSSDWNEDKNRTNSTRSGSDSGLYNGEPKGNEASVISCEECERLNVLRKDYHLLRKRLFSLFFWPALLTMTEPTPEQISSSDQIAATKTLTKAPVKKCGTKRRRSTGRGRRAGSDTEQKATAAVGSESQTKCPPVTRGRCAPKVKKATKCKQHEVPSLRATRKSPRHCR